MDSAIWGALGNLYYTHQGRDGADEPDYEQKIAPILNIKCHTLAINPSLPDLTNYAGVSEVAVHHIRV